MGNTDKTIKLILFNEDTLASIEVAVYEENTMKQIVEEFWEEIGLAEEQRKLYSRNATVSKMGLKDGQTFIFKTNLLCKGILQGAHE